MKNNLLPLSEYQRRREQFFAQMPENSIAFFAAATEVTRSNDTEFPFCQNKNFYYLTGFNEPLALLVLLKTDNSQQAILFCQEKDELAEIWHGKRVGATAAKSIYGFDQCFENNLRDKNITEYLLGKQQVWFCQGADNEFDQQLYTWLNKLRQQAKAGIKAPSILFDCREIVHEMRLIKSDAELAIMRKVNEISCNEYQLEAEIIHEFSRNGARYPAYGTIVAGGDNANILHYTDNNDQFVNGDLVLIDAGGELAGYAADITRTFPVNGKFSEAQKALYQIVLEAQNTVIAQIKPGQNFAYLNQLACDVITEGLVKLSLLEGDLAELKQTKACKKYFIHGLGHWLGLDVHDVGDYHINDKREQLRSFEPGMVMTIEPGLYIPANAEVEEKYRGIGIRIEDNILVTEQGYENFSITAPKSVEDIERIMAK